MAKGWVGVDLDGTLAYYHGWTETIGRPIEPMVQMVKQMLDQGIEVRIFTARANDPREMMKVEAWAFEVFGRKLAVTATKDYKMVALYDDRAVGVAKNTGAICGTCEKFDRGYRQ